MLETASIAGGATIAALLVFILCIVMYVHIKRKAKQSRAGSDCVDGAAAPVRTRPTFGTHWRQPPPEPDLPLNDRGDCASSLPSKTELHQVTTLLHGSGDP